MLYQLNNEANVWLHGLLRPNKTVPGKCSIDWAMKQMYALSLSSHQDGPWYMLWQLNYEANVCLFSFGHLRQAPVNALLTELWSKCQHCLLHPIKAVSGTCSINWTVKQMYALFPSSFQDSLWSMLYQLNYEANVCLVSFRVMLFQLNNEANVCFVSFV